MRVLAFYGLFLVTAVLAVAQAPLVEPGGVVDAASFKGPVMPGSLVSIFGPTLPRGLHPPARSHCLSRWTAYRSASTASPLHCFTSLGNRSTLNFRGRFPQPVRSA